MFICILLFRDTYTCRNLAMKIMTIIMTLTMEVTMVVVLQVKDCLFDIRSLDICQKVTHTTFLSINLRLATDI